MSKHYVWDDDQHKLIDATKMYYLADVEYFIKEIIELDEIGMIKIDEDAYNNLPHSLKPAFKELKWPT